MQALQGSMAIFVSSTFKDMQAERDMIRDRVMPEIAEFAARYGRFVDMVDLRWGISTQTENEASAQTKVLRTCFDEIDRSRPFFIVLLGDRYGWVPPEDKVLEALTPLGFTTQSPSQSVTALEIEYGALRAREKPVCLFYFRQGLQRNQLPEALRATYFDTGEDAQRLAALKAAIASRFPVREYHAAFDGETICGLDSLAECMKADITAALRQEWGEPPQQAPTWQQQEVAALDHFAALRLRRFRGREALLNRLIAATLGHGDATHYVLKGSPGTGKSALLCTLAQRLEAAGAFVLHFSAGISRRSFTLEATLSTLVYRLCRHLGREDVSDSLNGFEAIRNTFFQLVSEAAERGPVVILGDALNQFTPSAASTRLLWLRGLPPGVRTLCTLTEGPELEAFAELGAHIETLPDMSGEDITEIATSLVALHHKELDSRVLEAVLRKRDPQNKQAAQNPLYLTLLIHHLVMMNRHDHARADALTGRGMTPEDALTHVMQSLVDASPGEPKGQYMAFLSRIAELVGQDFVRTATALLALSPYGLREIDLESAFGRLNRPYSSADFSWLRQLMREYLAQGDQGQWDFTHTALREAVCASLDDTGLVDDLHIALANHFIQQNDAFSNRAVMHHLRGCNTPDAAAQLVGGVLSDGQLTPWFDIHAHELALIARRERQMPPRDSFPIRVLEAGYQLPPELRIHLGLFADILGQSLDEDTSFEYRIALLEVTSAMVMASARDAGGFTEVDVLSLSECWIQLCNLHVRMGNLEKAEAAAKDTLQLLEPYANDSRHPIYQHLLIRAYEVYGFYLEASGQPEAAYARYQQALALGEALYAENGVLEDKDRQAISMVKAAAAKLAAGADGARRDIAQGIAALEAAYAHNHSEDNTAHLSLAFCDLGDASDDPEASCRHYAKAVEILERGYAETASPRLLAGLLAALTRLGQTVGDLGHLHEAEMILVDAVHKANALYGRTGLHTDQGGAGEAYRVLGHHILYSGPEGSVNTARLDEVEALLRQSADRIEAARGTGDSFGLMMTHVSTLTLLGQCHFNRPGWSGDIEPFHQAIDLLRTLYTRSSDGSADSPGYENARDKLLFWLKKAGDLLCMAAQPEASLPYYQERVDFFRMLYENSTPKAHEAAAPYALEALTDYLEATRDALAVLLHLGCYGDVLAQMEHNAGLFRTYYEATQRLDGLSYSAVTALDLGDGYMSTGDYHRAAGHFDSARLAYSDMLTASPSLVGLKMLCTAEFKEGMALRLTGEADLSRQCLEAALMSVEQIHQLEPGAMEDMMAQIQAALEA